MVMGIPRPGSLAPHPSWPVTALTVSLPARPGWSGSKTVVGISVAIHQVETYLLWEGAVAVIDA